MTDADCADVEVDPNFDEVCSNYADSATNFCTTLCNTLSDGECATTVGAAGPVCNPDTNDTGNLGQGFCAD